MSGIHSCSSDLVNQLIGKTLGGAGDSDAHLMTLFSIAISMKAKRILELGVRNGDSTLPFILAASCTRGTVQSVDINDTKFICPDNLRDYWRFYKQDSLEFLKKLDRSTPYDIIYIDDWHAYEHVKEELQIIDGLVSMKSIIILHDLMYHTAPYYHCDLAVKTGQWANGGPYRAVAELDQNFWEFATIPVCNGLTILRKKYSSKYHILR